MLCATLFLVVGFALTACAFGLTSHKTLRYRITVTVETPEGLKTGSAVREAGQYWEKKILPEQGGTFYNVTKGEAVVIDLGKKGFLFGLIEGQDEAKLIFDSFPSSAQKGIALRPEQYPRFVRFQDLKEPKTVENARDIIKCPSSSKVCEGRIGYVALQSMKDKLGDGVQLKTVTIEMTSEPITTGIITLLPWLPDYYSRMLDGRRYNTIKADNKLANSLTSGHFAIGGS